MLHEFLLKSLNSNKVLLNIVNDILDLAQIESGSFSFNFGQFSLPELLKETIEIVMEDAKSKNLEIVLSVSK